MAVLVTELRAVYPTQRLDIEVQPFIDNAQLIYDEDIRSKYTYTAEREKLIVMYLAAHLMSTTDALAIDGSTAGGVLKRSKLGDADESYTTPDGTAFGLEATRWGQTALALDKSGILAGLTASKSLKAQFRVV